MKKDLYFLRLFAILLVLLPTISLSGFAQQNPQKQKARAFVNQTSKILILAKQTVLKDKMDKADLIKAFSHQKLAKKLMAEGKLKQALQHSMRARQLVQTIVAVTKQGKGKALKMKNNVQNYGDESAVEDMPKAEDLDNVIPITELQESILNEGVEKPETR